MKPFLTRILLLAAFLLSAIGSHAGSLYLVDNSGPTPPLGAIYRIDTATGEKTLFATVADLTPLTGIAVDAKGNVFVSGGFSEGAILRFDPDGRRSAFATKLASPTGLAFNPSGILFATTRDTGTFRFATDGAAEIYAYGPLNSTGLAFSSRGLLYVTSVGGLGGSVTSINLRGEQTTFATGQRSPSSLTVDPQFDNPIVADAGRGKIFSYLGFNGQHYTAVRGLGQPAGLAFDNFDNFYLVDANSASIIKISDDGTRRFNGTHTVLAAGFMSPGALAFDPSSAPVVTITADRASVSRSLGEVATLTLTRTGDLTERLAVFVDLPFIPPPTSMFSAVFEEIDFPIGQATVQSATSAGLDPIGTVQRFKLQSGSRRFTVGTPAKVKILVTD